MAVEYNVHVTLYATAGNLQQLGQTITEALQRFNLTQIPMTMSIQTDENQEITDTPEEIMGWIGSKLGENADVGISIT